MTMTRAKSATGVVRSMVAVLGGVVLAAGCATMGGAKSQASVPVLSQAQVANRAFVRLNEVKSPASCVQDGADVTFEGMQGLQAEAKKASADALTNVSCGEGTPTDSCAHTFVCHGDAIRWSEGVAGSGQSTPTAG